MAKIAFQHDLPQYGIAAVSHSHSQDFKTAMHSHPFASLFYVVGGKGVLDIREKGDSQISRMEFATDTAVILGPHVTHQMTDKPRNPVTLFVVYFDKKSGPANNIMLQDIGWLYGKAINPGPFAAGVIRKQLRKILSEQSQKSVGYEAAIICGFNEILVELRRAAAKPNEHGNSAQKRAASMLEHIRNNYSQPYSLPEIAAEAGLSERHLTNLCRTLTGMSVCKYVEGLRLRRAKELLESTAMPAAAIAFEVGYEELSTFYRAFKTAYGLSPIAYRNKKVR